MRYIKPLNEKKPKGAPGWHDADYPDAEGRFKDLSPKDLAAWLIKTRKKDMSAISGALVQQVVFNRKEDPEYADKMEKTRKEVYKQLGREDLLDKMDESLEEPIYNSFFFLEFKSWVYKNRAKINRMSKDEKIAYLEDNYIKKYGNKHLGSEDLSGVGSDIYHAMVLDKIIKESVNEAKFPGRKGDFIKWKDGYYDIKKTSGSTAYVKFPHTASSAFSQVWDDEVTLSDEKHRGKKVWLMESNSINEEDSYNDYPAAAKANAKKAIEWKEKYGRDEVDAGTAVGWQRAHQLAKGEKISADTVKRMASFNRHRKNSSIKAELKDTPWKDKGYVSWLIWGGDEGVDWAMEKSKEIDAMKESKQLKYIKPLNERVKHTSTDFSKPGNDGDIYFSKREGEAVGVRLGDKLQMIYVFQGEPKLGRIQKSDKRWENMGPASEELLIDLRGREEGEILFKFVSTLEESNQLNEGYWSGYDYDKWTKENGKPKYPKWVKVTLKEIVKGGFMDSVYDSEHMYMVLWLGSFDNQRRAELSAYDKKGIKEFGKVGYKMVRDKWNDLTGYTMFSMMGAMYALEVSKHVRDMQANGESIEPAYYLMKEYFNNFGMDTKRSRIFNAAYEKLEKWMKDNNIKTL